MRSRTAMIAKIGVLSGTSVAVGFLLSSIPNVEGMSAITFLSGCLLGPIGGIAVGAIGISVFSVLNPLGPPLPPVLAAQVIAMSLFGLFGSMWKASTKKATTAILAAGLLGGVLTLLYGLLTDLAFAASIGRLRHPLPVIVAGIPFSALHIFSNVAIFIGVGGFLVRRANQS